ncbi:5'-nucleotidase C-terminal domain-containing protein [Saccharococcus sp. Marseille-Q5394]|uniref:5'-nucleotidase C-terminal domain-containing protein n=1 Tax=Saccharococcus sp. Marseille-Q5394 TaxID=2972778 RepID=UPI0021C90F92|nr:5'-nucleotidase C-terminal domain-containing protein [Saccharococcus sp. Marseille-Q5394]
MVTSKKYRKFLTTAAVATLVASAVTPASAEFKDSTGQYSDAVAYLTANGIAKGLGDGYFGISETLKRGDVAVMIAKALYLDTSNVSDIPFKDVNRLQMGAVNALYKAGILSGKSKTSFAPDDVITRVELAKILSNAYGLKAESNKTKFKDVNSNWAPYVDALVSSGIARGKSANEFGSSQSVTRGEFALFVFRGRAILKDSVVDETPPVIHYEGVKSLTLSYGATFSLPNVTATDDKDGNVKVTTVIQNSKKEVVDRINTLRPDTYTVTYSAQDKAGNKAKELIITVVVNQQVIYTPSPTPPKDKNYVLSIMHFNDTHSHLDNAAKRVTAVKEVRTKKPSALLLDAGDVFSGTLYFNEFLGQADLEFMNLMKVDAMTFGNHEFDLGSSEQGHQALVDFIEAAQFPFVSSNVDFSKDKLFTGLFNTKISSAPNNGNIYTGIVKEVNGEKVGIFGLTTADTVDISSPGSITFSNYIEQAKKMVAEFEAMGVNKIVAITHIGYDDNPAVDNDLELAKAVEGIDIIVGGHSHTKLDKPVLFTNKKQPTIIVQAYQYAENLGTLDVAFDKNGIVVEHNGELIPIGSKVEDPDAAEILKKYADRINQVKNEETGSVAVKELANPRLSDSSNISVRSNETPLGNVITDGMLAKAKEYAPDVIMAMQNGGGIRKPINQGPITVGEVIEVLPFGNTLAMMKLTGAEIKEAFETSFKEYPKENGGFLHVSGAKVEFDSSKPVGDRVVSVKYNSGNDVYVEIEDAKTYTIATNAFTAKGGDGFDVFKRAYEEGRVVDLGLSDWENFRDHLVSLVTVDPEVEGRIVDIAKENGYPAGDYDGEEFSGTVDAPKVYNGDVTVDISKVLELGHAVVRGNLTIFGTLTEALRISNIKVEGDLILTDLNGAGFNLDDVEVDGDTIVD